MVQRRRQGRPHDPRRGRSNRLKFYKVACSVCGKEVVVQVAPPDGKKLLCMECFKK